MSTRPVFVISLPRSGSTLVQQLLSTSPDVASTAEPWILLPLWAQRNAAAGRAVYFHHAGANAINDFVAAAGGEQVYAKAVAAYGNSLYGAAAAGKPIFLDKTPRYHLMLDLISSAFPESPRVILLRHPLSVLASICETFHRGRFRWFEYWIDWIDGHRNLAKVVRQGRSQDMVVHYERLVQEPVTEVQKICRHIGASWSSDMTTRYRDVDLQGRMGDPTGVHRYDGVSNASSDRWRAFFNTPYRQRKAKWMLSLIEPADLETLGYPMSRLIGELNDTPASRKWDWSARRDQAIDRVANAIDFRYLQARLRARQQGHPYAYGYLRRP